VFAAVKPAERDGLIAGWKDVAARIAPTVLLRLTGAAFTHVTTGWLRFDVTIAVPDAVPDRWRSEHRLLFDHAGLDDRLGMQSSPPEISAAHVSDLTEEFLRVLCLLPVVLGREELEVAASDASLFRQMLVQLLVEEAGGDGRGGALRLRQMLAPDQLRLLRDLPPIAASRESATAVHIACARAFLLPVARGLVHRLGATWPRELEAATVAHLHRVLDIDI